MKSAIVIGSGIAGIASALRLRRQGFNVQVFEANEHPGGKINSFEEKGYRFDMGPSLFTLPHLVDELFELYDLNPRAHFNYHRKEIVCNYFWEDGTRFTAKADKPTFIKEAADTFNEAPDTIASYLDRNTEKYRLTSPLFLEKSLHDINTYLSWQTLKSVVKSSRLDLFSSMDDVNRRSLKHPHLVQLFNRYATYNGSSPYKAPGILTMIPHLEMDLGTFFPEGGMQSISQSLFDLAKRQDIHFHFNCPVRGIKHEGQKATAVITDGGEEHADVVVSNADIYSTYRKLLPDIKAPEKTLRQERSSSALIFYWGLKRTSPELDLHNILFSDDYEKEFDHLFNRKLVYEDPTLYINITSKEEQGDAPKGCENWFVMVNVPGNSGQDWPSIIKETRNRTIEKVSRMLGVQIEPHLEVERILDPVTIESTTRSYQGSLYGTSSNSRMSSFLRHPNFSSRLKNLYFCGGSVHPGGGIPLALQSAKIATNLIK